MTVVDSGLTSHMVKFKKGSQAVTMPGPQNDQPLPSRTGFVTGVTASYKRYAYKLTANKPERWTLNFRDIPSVLRQELQTFFEIIAEGPLGFWEYTHTSGHIYGNVRFTDTELQWNREGPDMFGVDITLELDIDAADKVQ